MVVVVRGVTAASSCGGGAITSETATAASACSRSRVTVMTLSPGRF